MYVHMYVCKYVGFYACMCIVSMYSCMSVRARVCERESVYVCADVCIYVWKAAGKSQNINPPHVFVRAFVCVCERESVCVRVCVRVRVCMNV